MPAKLTQKQAWRKIADAFEAYANGAPVVERDSFGSFGALPLAIRTDYGLCAAIDQLWVKGKITERTANAMYDRQYALVPIEDRAAAGVVDAFWWPTHTRHGPQNGRQGARERAIFATLMAEVSR